MRPSSLDLTMNIYAEPQLLDVAGALDALAKSPLPDKRTPADSEFWSSENTGPRAVRIGQTVYKQKPTRVLLKNVTRKQLAAMIHQLTCAQTGLQADSLRLAAPRPEDTTDHWNAELVISYLIYDPTKQHQAAATPTPPRRGNP